MFENWVISFNCEKQSLLRAELKNLTTKQRKNSFVCAFDAAFLPNVFRVFEKLWAVFNSGKKLFKPAQVALTKIRRSEDKIYQKTDFLSSEGHLLTSPGCCLTLASSPDVYRDYRVLLGTTFLSCFSSFAKVQCLHFSSSKVRCSRF